MSHLFFPPENAIKDFEHDMEATMTAAAATFE